MNKLLFFFLSLVLGSFSCSNSTNEQRDDKLSPDQLKVKEFEDEVLAIHDEVMPLMGNLVSLKVQLEEENKSLSASLETSASDQVILNNLVISKLDAAHEGMMHWMRKYRRVDHESDPYVTLKYLEEQKYIIGLVRDLVNDAIGSANDSLNIKDKN